LVGFCFFFFKKKKTRVEISCQTIEENNEENVHATIGDKERSE
jgi:hypothetical protein